jgi:hypothetical protein
VPGSAHSSCKHPDLKEVNKDPFAGMAGMMAIFRSVGRGEPAIDIMALSKKFEIRANPQPKGAIMKFKILGQKGDAEFDYDTIEMQEIKFKELSKSGLLPMVAESGKNRMLKSFEPDANEIIWIPKIAGG